jgi:hypothetical protein
VLLWQAFAWGSRGVLRGGDALWGMLSLEDRTRGFDLLGAFCGGWFLVFLAAFIRGAPAASPGRKALAAAVVLVSAITWTFVGHIEFYAPLYAGLMFFYWRASRFFLAPSDKTYFWMILAAFVAVTMHRVALFHMPALILVWLRPAFPPRWIRPTAAQVKVVLGFVIARLPAPCRPGSRRRRLGEHSCLRGLQLDAGTDHAHDAGLGRLRPRAQPTGLHAQVPVRQSRPRLALLLLHDGGLAAGRARGPALRAPDSRGMAAFLLPPPPLPGFGRSSGTPT